MDVADFLQMLSTPDGATLFNPPDDKRSTPYTMSELAEAFRSSDYGTRISRDLKKPWKLGWASRRFSLDAEEMKGSGTHVDMSDVENKYMNSFPRSLWLNLKRSFVIWTRDKRFIMVNAIKNAIMGVSVGGVFWQTDDVVSKFGVLFQAMLFIMLGAMVAAPAQVADRAVYYRHSDANFYPAFPYVFGKAIAVIPQVSVVIWAWRKLPAILQVAYDCLDGPFSFAHSRSVLTKRFVPRYPTCRLSQMFYFLALFSILWWDLQPVPQTISFSSFCCLCSPWL